VRVTIADIALRAGVSKTTVSRVLNGKPDLDRDTAARVRRIIDELGYVPSSGAVGLARGRTRLVGLLVPSLRWPWMGELLQGAVDLLESESYGLLMHTCHRGDASLRRFSSQASARSFDGLLVIEPEGTLDYITDLHRRGLPVVIIDDRGRHPRFPSVATTNFEGGAQAARHLLDTGRTEIAMITGPKVFGCAVERATGFAGQLTEAGHGLHRKLVQDGEFSFEGGRCAARRLLDGGRRFDAVFAHNDLSAAGAIHALRAASVRVPADVAVVGFDDIPLAQHTDPPLTTIHQPLLEMGASAARMLVSAMGGASSGGGEADGELLPTSLVVRASTGPEIGAHTDPVVAGRAHHDGRGHTDPVVAGRAGADGPRTGRVRADGAVVDRTATARGA
jgi:LacI family transcriptional regulator